MDPVSTIGVASSVITFVEFATSLISTTKKVHHSIDGTLPGTLRAEQVYETLQRLNARLQTPASRTTASSQRPAASEDVSALVQLSAGCKDDCQKLLDILQRLKVRDDHNRLWESVRVVLKSKAERKNITEIEERLEMAQRVMTLHVGNILRDQVAGITISVDNLGRENERLLLNQASKMEELSKGIEELKLQIPPPPKRLSVLDEDAVYQRFRESGESVKPDEKELSSDKLENHRKSLLKLLKSEDDLTREQAILASLDFEARPGRYETIPQAYTATFEWAFNSTLSRWLQKESGIFWICGKAGSGKSTLMKYAVNHLRTQNLLREWSSPRPITIAAHYFWAAGSAMQKSQTGLLRTLLYEVSRQCPSYMPILCPNRWTQLSEPKRKGENQSWSYAELSQALRTLAFQEDLPTNFCFFIDGMDEYNDDHLELCSVLRNFSKSSHIKLCVSSRPWNVFTDNFGQDPKNMLKVHEFTQNDILVFSRARMESHPRWTMCSFQKQQKEDIIMDIGDRAGGVFLWSFLVTKSLREGLTNGDTIRELRTRLDSLPTDLERLFKHMLDQIDSFYHEKTAGMLQLALHARAPLKLDMYGYHDMEYDDENYALHHPVKERLIGERLDLYDDTRRRVNSRTNGLLECRENSYTVDFLHRTVSDFLRTKEMTEYIESKTRRGFDVYVSITSAFITYIKSTRFRDGILRLPPPNRNTGPLIEQLGITLEYASQVGQKYSAQIFALLDELECALEDLFRIGQASFPFETCQPKIVFREEILRSNSAGYLAKKLRDIPDYLSGLEVTPISVAVSAELPPVGTSRILLQNGEDPNGVSKLVDGIFTVFAMYLMVIFCPPDYIRKSEEYLRTLDDFLDAGADFGAKLELDNESYDRLNEQHHLTCSRWWPDRGGQSSVFQAFVSGLEAWKQRPGVRHVNDRFLADVVRRTITHRKTPRHYTDYLGSIVLRVFGEHIAMPLVNLINGVSVGQDKLEHDKRKRKGVEGEEQTQKRHCKK